MTDNFRLQVLEDALRTIADIAMGAPTDGLWVSVHGIAASALDAVSEAPDGTPIGLLLDRENARGRAEEMQG
jgi:hypothetical protein